MRVDGELRLGAAEVTIKRDTWGVPHIFAATLPDAAYGLGYAQAEDRLDRIFGNYRLAIGRAAEVDGPSASEQDWEQRLAGTEEVCRRRYRELPAEVRAMCEAYQDGVRAWLAAHPGRQSAQALAMEPWMVPAVGRRLILGWPLGWAKTLLDERDTIDFYSNEWAVRPERTADGAALLLIDPHVSWDGLFRAYEFRLHAGGHDIAGFGAVGTPFLALGHNAHLGWACTTGGPVTTDVYVEQVDPANPLRYRYDDAWREMTTQSVTIAVRDAPTVTRTLERSHHGPIAARAGGQAFAVACPYLDQVDTITQLYRMMTARCLADWDAAMAMCQLMEQNVLYADVEGHIRYIRTGRVPIRPAGFDFHHPVPGHTSRSEWLGLHRQEDLVNLLDPPTAYLQNCNIGPDTMATGLGLDLERWPWYITGAEPGESNSRGRRAVELLDAHPKLTIDQAQAIALDDHADGCECWLAQLRAAAPTVDWTAQAKAAGVDPAALRLAVELLLAWDGHMDQTSAAATIYRGWRQETAALGAETPAHALLGLLSTVRWLTEHFGRVDVPYGQLHRVRRGDRSWPVSGGDSGGGHTVRAVSADDENGVRYGHAGQNWLQLVQLRPGAVRSWSLTPYGQSDDPNSPHYADQAEQLFSPGRLKPTWFQPDELAGYVESTLVLPR